LPKDYGRSVEPGCFIFDQAGTQNRNATAAVGWLGIANEDHVGLVEVSCEQNIHKSGLALDVNSRDIAEGRGLLAVPRNNTHPSGPLGHQHAAVG
jgi:hypothetical protein